jgi:hypothetical protein
MRTKRCAVAVLLCAWVLWHLQSTTYETTGAADPSSNSKRETSGEFIQEAFTTLADCNSAKPRRARAWIDTMASAGWSARRTANGVLATKERRWAAQPRDPKDAKYAQMIDAMDARSEGSVMKESVYVEAKCLPDTIDPRGSKR